MAAGAWTNGCGPPLVWNGSGWVDRVVGDVVVVIEGRRQLVVPRRWLPENVVEGDYVSDRTIIQSRRVCAEQRIRDKLRALTD
ncbi:MAG: DUF3006 family protein [Deltaproteobacteria bacterium]|nr:DUF3006 family protein [Deltaproteobacteria bacterium]